MESPESRFVTHWSLSEWKYRSGIYNFWYSMKIFLQRMIMTKFTFQMKLLPKIHILKMSWNLNFLENRMCFMELWNLIIFRKLTLMVDCFRLFTFWNFLKIYFWNCWGILTFWKIARNKKFDYFPKTDFDSRNLKAVTCCLLFETATDFFKLLWNFNFLEDSINYEIWIFSKNWFWLCPILSFENCFEKCDSTST